MLTSHFDSSYNHMTILRAQVPCFHWGGGGVSEVFALQKWIFPCTKFNHDILARVVEKSKSQIGQTKVKNSIFWIII